jgi:hypothetical protein
MSIIIRMPPSLRRRRIKIPEQKKLKATRRLPGGFIF